MCLFRTGAALVLILAVATAIWIHLDRRPSLKMLVEVVGSGGSTAEATRDLDLRLKSSLRLIQNAGVPIVELRQLNVQPSSSSADSFVAYRYILLRDSDEGRLTRLYLALRQSSANPSLPQVAFLPRDWILIFIVVSAVLGFGVLEKGRQTNAVDPITARRLPLIASFFAAGLLVCAAMLIDSRSAWLRFAPFALAALILPFWDILGLFHQTTGNRTLKKAVSLCALVVASPVGAWLIRLATLRT